VSKKNKYRYLLDTNILSELVKKPQGVVAQKIIDVGDDKICTSIIVASEIRFGAEKRQSKPLSQQVEAILSAIDILPYQSPADSHYAKLRTNLEKAGTPIGPNGMFIAAHALALGLILVSANEREFSRVTGLRVENWMHP
jgi:tRNA(fMet)-specific endonuclease VapC